MSGRPAPGGERRRWLDDKRNVDRLVYLLYLTCGVLFVADFFYEKHGHFDFENWPGFFGWFGFASYVGIVTSAKAWRRLVRRDEDYYERRGDTPGDGP